MGFTLQSVPLRSSISFSSNLITSSGDIMLHMPVVSTQNLLIPHGSSDQHRCPKTALSKAGNHCRDNTGYLSWAHFHPKMVPGSRKDAGGCDTLWSLCLTKHPKTLCLALKPLPRQYHCSTGLHLNPKAYVILHGPFRTLLPVVFH